MKDRKVTKSELKQIKGGFDPQFTVSDTEKEAKLPQVGIYCLQPVPIFHPCHNPALVDQCF